jgi:hypothetical protein
VNYKCYVTFPELYIQLLDTVVINKENVAKYNIFMIAPSDINKGGTDNLLKHFYKIILFNILSFGFSLLRPIKQKSDMEFLFYIF